MQEVDHDDRIDLWKCNHQQKFTRDFLKQPRVKICSCQMISKSGQQFSKKTVVCRKSYSLKIPADKSHERFVENFLGASFALFACSQFVEVGLAVWTRLVCRKSCLQEHLLLKIPAEAICRIGVEELLEELFALFWCQYVEELLKNCLKSYLHCLGPICWRIVRRVICIVCGQYLVTPLAVVGAICWRMLEELLALFVTNICWYH